MKEFEKARNYFQIALSAAAQSSDDYGVNQSGYYEIGTAIKAIEKQIPKRPKIYGKEKIKACFCNECNTAVLKGQKYCFNCGQALDWNTHPTEKGGEADA